ncbi:MAG: hypothetical protein JNL42_05985 [Anaerolineae bacterium]|nr:hypothetical protein [Anaerolineae bacterium]
MNALIALPPVRWVLKHPRLSAWTFLSVGMIVLLFIEARDVGLLPGQWFALVVACILVAGICIWIVSWEDGDEEDEPAAPKLVESAAESADKRSGS